jgi:hypothetical protein
VSITPFPATAAGKAVFKVVCGLFGGFTFTFATEPIITTDVPSIPWKP